MAGLVGIGLSSLFSASGLEDASVGSNQKLSNSMGLFLQKTNIIRDYFEDVVQGRHFWPSEVCNVEGYCTTGCLYRPFRMILVSKLSKYSKFAGSLPTETTQCFFLYSL